MTDAFVPCQRLCLHQGRLVFPHAADAGFEQGLNLPAAYFKRCPPALQDANFNWWNQSEEVGRQFEKADTDPDPAWLLRSKGSTLRGVLSSKYARLDNAGLLDVLLPLSP